VARGRERLRGLDPSAVAGSFFGGPDPAPAIPGWILDAPLGEGGLGTVWSATRHSDGQAAAIKTPRTRHLAVVERIELEAEALRSLDHPHVVKWIESGPLEHGGLYIAMQRVDGSSLSQSLPAQGFDPARGFELFRQICSGVAHAHIRGVLHRDLKPGNILIDADGRALVADFGLAQPVHERVHQLSLTQVGTIAGTAEYLPPEAYRANYVPSVQTDVYALGVILHELLTGSPPRGAWESVSKSRRIDVRIDDVLRRALDPDPARRWPSVEAMSSALEEIHRSPPRYSGAPLVTPATRVADAAWSLLGVFLLVAVIGVVLRINNAEVHWPIDFVGNNGLRTGGVLSVLLLLIASVPLSLWQIIRLRRFRRIPLREALPSPLGLRLGTSRTAAALVLAAQLFFLALPALGLLDVWRDSTKHWLKPGDPPWVPGLVLTGGTPSRPIELWEWPEPKAVYRLRERHGWIGDPQGNDSDRIDFRPGVFPLIMVVTASLWGLALFAPLLRAVSLWWRRNPLRLAVLLVTTTLTGWAGYRLATPAKRVIDTIYWGWVQLRVKERLPQVLGPQPPTWETPPEEVAETYANQVDFRDAGILSKDRVLALLAEDARVAREQGRWAAHVLDVFRPEPETRRAYTRFWFLECTDPPGQPSTAALTVLKQELALAGDYRAEVTVERRFTLPIYTADQRVLLAAEAESWVRGFFGALHSAPPTEGEDPLTSWFHEPQLAFQEFNFVVDPPLIPLPRAYHLTTLRRAFANGHHPHPVFPLPPAESQPGARQKLTVPITEPDVPAPRPWILHLVYTNDRWVAVSLDFR
jgi:hypothetical protein